MNRNEGALLMEIAIALTVFTVGLLSFLGTYFSSAQGVRSFENLDEARIALDNAAETLKDAAFDTLYDTYHGTQIEVPELQDSNGAPANIVITCYVNEQAIPAAFGGLTDINGVVGDNSTDCSGDYKILPVGLSLTYAGQNGNETRELHIVLDSGNSTAP